MGIRADSDAEASKRGTILTMAERVASAAGCRYVDQVIPDAPWQIDAAWIETYDMHLVVHGDDDSQEPFGQAPDLPLPQNTVAFSLG